MSTTLPVGATLADDADARVAFEAFVRADGRRRRPGEEDVVQSETSVINHDDDEDDVNPSHDRPKMTARNVGEETFGRRQSSRAYVACDGCGGTSGTCVGSDGTTGEATLGRLPVRARDGGDASTSTSTRRRVVDTDPLKIGDAIWCGAEHAVATLVVMDDARGADCALATTRADGDATKDEVLYWRAGWKEARPIVGLRGVECACARVVRGDAKEEEEGVVR